MKAYLGDGVYVDINQYGQIVLTTENGIGASNTIYLEPEVYQALTEYVKRLKQPDINNSLLVPIEQDDECPNCHNGTVERTSNDTYVCRGECGAFFRGPINQPIPNHSDDIPY